MVHVNQQSDDGDKASGKQLRGVHDEQEIYGDNYKDVESRYLQELVVEDCEFQGYEIVDRADKQCAHVEVDKKPDQVGQNDHGLDQVEICSERRQV